jgi:hypothetical protein
LFGDNYVVSNGCCLSSSGETILLRKFEKTRREIKGKLYGNYSFILADPGNV